MKIAILCFNMHLASSYVVGTNVVNCLKRAAPSHQFLLIAPVGCGHENSELPSGSKVVLVDQHKCLFARWKFYKFRLPKIIKDFGTDIVFGLSNLVITHPGCKQAVVLTDAHYVYSERHYIRERLSARLEKWFISHELKKSLQYVDFVFCQTPVTKKTVCRCFQLSGG